MTTRYEEEPEHPAVPAVQAEAQWLVQTMCDALAAKGWDLVVVSVSRRVDIDRAHVVAPGATGLHCNQARMREALGTNAAALRRVADQLEAMTDTSRADDVGGYVHDISRADKRSWP